MGDAEFDLGQAAPFAGAMPVALLGLDAAETGLLALLRHLMTTLDQPETQSWEYGFVIAAERWGKLAGPQVVLAAMALVKALRQARPGHFRYADPLDLTARGHVSAEEACLMRMLRAMRQDITPEARGQMALLTGGRIDPGLVQCGIALARTLPAPSKGGVMSRPAHGLRLVH